MSRAFGPHRPSANSEPVRSVIVTRSSSRICRRIHARSCCPLPPPVTTRNELLVLAGHREVAADPARRREHRPCRRSSRPAGRSGSRRPARGTRARRAPRRRTSRTASGRRAPRSTASRGARRPRSATRTCAAQPVARAPRARRRTSARVRLEPLRALPPGAGDELGAELLVALVERRQPEPARARHLLAAGGGCRTPRGTAACRVRARTAASSGTGRSGSRRPRPGRIEGSPVTIHSATCRAEPAGVRDPHGLADPDARGPRADSPTIEPASGVNENIPLIERSGSAGRMRPASAGSSRAASASATSKSPGVNGISDGIGPSPGRRSADCGVAIGSWLVVARPRSGPRGVGSTSPCPGDAGSGARPRASRPASSGIGSVHTSWCCTATQRDRHAGHRADGRAPRSRRRSARARTRPSPRSVSHARARGRRGRRTRSRSTPPSNADARRASAAAPERRRDPDGLARSPSEGTWYAPRIVEGSSSGIFSAASAGVSSSVPSSPYERANPSRRFSSAHPRLGVVATSIPPTPYQAGSPSSVERCVQRDRLLRDPAHHARAVRLEGEPGRVRGRAAGLEQRTLVEHEHVGLAELGQVVRGARADDPGADDHRLGTIAHPAPSPAVLCWCMFSPPVAAARFQLRALQRLPAAYVRGRDRPRPARATDGHLTTGGHG